MTEQQLVEGFRKLAEADESGDFVRLMIRQLLSETKHDMNRDMLIEGLTEVYGENTQPYPITRLLKATFALLEEGVSKEKILEYVGAMEHGMADSEEVYSDTLSWSWVFDSERYTNDVREYNRDSI